MTVVIFEIDDHFVPDAFVQNFLDHPDTEGNLIVCTGSYKGEVNLSFICTKQDYDNYVDPMLYTALQESVLEVTQCNKAYGTLVYLEDGRREGIGCIKAVTQEEAMQHEAWTYRPDLNTFFIAVQDSNDTRPPHDGWGTENTVRIAQSEYDALLQSAHRLSLVERALSGSL